MSWRTEHLRTNLTDHDHIISIPQLEMVIDSSINDTTTGLILPYQQLMKVFGSILIGVIVFIILIFGVIPQFNT